MLSRELAAKHCSVEQALETKYITQINALKEELAYEKIRALGVRSARAAAAVAEQKANLHLEEAINFRVMMNPTFGKSDLKCADETLARRDRMIQARDAKLEADGEVSQSPCLGPLPCLEGVRVMRRAPGQRCAMPRTPRSRSLRGRRGCIR